MHGGSMLGWWWTVQEAVGRAQEVGRAAADDESLTFAEVLADIPHDGAAFTLYAIVAFSVFLVWWGHRNAGRDREGVHPIQDESGREERSGEDPRRPAA